MLELMKTNSKASSPDLVQKWGLEGFGSFLGKDCFLHMLVLHCSQSTEHQILFEARYYDR